MPIITAAELASYLELDNTPALEMKAQMADAIVTEAVYPLGLPTVVPARVKAITLEVAARAVRNVNGYSSETIDDYTYRRPEGTREAGVYLTSAELSDLLALTGQGRPTVRSIRLTSPLDPQ